MIVGKKCQTRGGFQRHGASKHSDIQTHTRHSYAKHSRRNRQHCFSQYQEIHSFCSGLRNELDFYVYEQLVDGTVEFFLLKSLFDGYLDKGDSEKFYAKYYTQVPLHSANFFKGL